MISIRAPLGGRDKRPGARRTWTNNFNPRAPWGARPGLAGLASSLNKFQSARPLGGATNIQISGNPSDEISIRAPLGGRDPG